MDAVIFDLGNVLLTLHWERMYAHFSRHTGKSQAELEQYHAGSPWSRQLATGEISQWDYYEAVSQELGFTGSFDEFAAAWSDMFSPNEPVLTLAHRLKGKLPRYVSSNTNAIHMRFIFDRFPCVRGFEGYILSHEIGVEKPDRRIYDWAIRRYELEPGRTVFVDDLEENVAGARAAGLQAIHHRDAGETRRELTKLGVPHI